MSSRGKLVASLAVVASLLAIPAAANAAVLSNSPSTIFYVAEQGESNDLRVEVRELLGVPVYAFTDNDATPITIGSPSCELVNGVGLCSGFGISNLHVNTRDKDDTIKISIGGPLGPVNTSNTLIGGRGIDVIMGGNGADRLKGNNGRDALRGRKGPDVYKGGRGSDTLQTLDGAADTHISCGPGHRDLVRADKQDPEPKNCELGKRAKPSKRR